MKKNIFSLIILTFLLLALLGCSCKHEWNDATCLTPKSCSKCAEAEGEALGHTWIDATCTSPKICAVCGTAEGGTLDHTWNAATCTTPKTCSGCKTTIGTALEHNWLPASCEEPETCTNCGSKKGDPLGHTKGDWYVAQDATVYQVGIREQKCTTCDKVIRSEEFSPDPVIYATDFGMSTAEFITVFNKLSDGDYEIKPDGDDYVVHWLGFLDVSTSISFTENASGLLTSISLDGRKMAEHGNRQVEICWTMFRVLNPHLSESDSMDEFKYAASSGGKSFIRGVRYLYTELSSLDTLWFTIQLV